MNESKKLFDDNEDGMAKILSELSESMDSKDIPVLVELLNNTSNQTIKHKIALLLHDFNDPVVLKALIDEISKPSSKGYRGTLVYACEAFDCSDYLDFFIDLIINDSNEVAMTSVMVIENMKKIFSDDTLAIQISKLQTALINNSNNYESIEEAIDYLGSLS